MLSKLKYRSEIIHTLLPYTIGARKCYLLIFLCTILLMILDFINPLFYKLFIEKVILQKSFGFMSYIVVGYLTIFMTSTLIGYLKKHAEYRFIHKVLYRIKSKIFLGILNLEFDQYDEGEIGDRKLRLDDDTALVREFTSAQTTDYALSFLTMLICGSILFCIDWRLAIFSLAAIPTTFLLDDLVSRYEKRINKIKRENAQEKTTWLHASLQGWREVKALNLGRWQLQSFVKYIHVQALCNARWINCWTTRRLILPKIKEEFFMRFGLYFIGGLLIASSKLDIGDLLLFVIYYEMMAKAMNQVSTADAQLQSDMPVMERFMEELKKEDSVTDSARNDCPAVFSGIEMQNISFQYPGSNKEVLTDFNLHIHPGDRIAIIGKSGSGKSTILKLLTGMLSPTSGRITYSGIDIKSLNKEQLYGQIGLVMQDNILFHMSIAENLRYGKGDATTAEMLEACKKSGIYDFITSLPLGLNTIIGEKGLKLSGGQRQRIVLARLFLQDAQVYIFDEATSALDQYSESLVQDTLKSLPKEKTLIIVAHRESSIRLCDRIVRIS